MENESNFEAEEPQGKTFKLSANGEKYVEDMTALWKLVDKAVTTQDLEPLQNLRDLPRSKRVIAYQFAALWGLKNSSFRAASLDLLMREIGTAKPAMQHAYLKATLALSNNASDICAACRDALEALDPAEMAPTSVKPAKTSKAVRKRKVKPVQITPVTSIEEARAIVNAKRRPGKPSRAETQRRAAAMALLRNLPKAG